MKTGKRLLIALLILMLAFAAIRIGTSTYENAARARGQIPYQAP